MPGAMDSCKTVQRQVPVYTRAYARTPAGGMQRTRIYSALVSSKHFSAAAACVSRGRRTHARGAMPAGKIAGPPGTRATSQVIFGADGRIRHVAVVVALPACAAANDSLMFRSCRKTSGPTDRFFRRHQTDRPTADRGHSTATSRPTRFAAGSHLAARGNDQKTAERSALARTRARPQRTERAARRTIDSRRSVGRERDEAETALLASICTAHGRRTAATTQGRLEDGRQVKGDDCLQTDITLNSLRFAPLQAAWVVSNRTSSVWQS